MISLTQHINFKTRRFKRLVLNTVIVLYCLILAGGVVRSTGAGMGCPDWPKCFGRWIPPTEISELPADYKQIYGAKLKGEVEFNAVKTWIEYVNRLLGAFTGIVIFCTFLGSIHFLRSGNQHIFYLSLLALLLVGVQGWLGSKVVSTELMPVMITMHMLLAVIIVLIAIYLFTWSRYSFEWEDRANAKSFLSKLGLLVLLFSLIQILLGTQVRESMDVVIGRLGAGARMNWIDELGTGFYVHRSFSLLLLGINVFWYYSVKEKHNKASLITKVGGYCLVVLGIEVLTGIIMAYFGVPAFAQPLHLTLAIVLIGLQFMLWLLVNGERYLIKVS